MFLQNKRNKLEARGFFFQKLSRHLLTCFLLLPSFSIDFYTLSLVTFRTPLPSLVF